MCGENNNKLIWTILTSLSDRGTNKKQCCRWNAEISNKTKIWNYHLFVRIIKCISQLPELRLFGFCFQCFHQSNDTQLAYNICADFPAGIWNIKASGSALRWQAEDTRRKVETPSPGGERLGLGPPQTLSTRFLDMTRFLHRIVALKSWSIRSLQKLYFFAIWDTLKE